MFFPSLVADTVHGTADLRHLLRGTERVADVTRTAGPQCGAENLAPLLAELMDLLETRPKVVLLLGKQAQEAWSQLLVRASPELKGLPVIAAPHPSPLAHNKTDALTGRPNRPLLQEAFAQATAMSQTNAT